MPERHLMEPTLHNCYLEAEAIAAFGPDEAPAPFCDKQFLVLQSVVLCFFTIGDTSEEPHVLSPSEVVWRPKTGAEPVTRDDWLPEKVREVWDRSGTQITKLRTHHIFLRARTDDQFFYASEAHLASYGSSIGSEPGVAASFSLIHKLPRPVWLKLGGYPGWLVEVNHKSHRITSGNQRAFERVVGKLNRKKRSHLCMTRYEEDSLTVHINSTRGWLMCLRDPGDSGVYTRDLAYNGPPDPEEAFGCACGIDLEFPPSQTISRELAAKAAMEFFQTGRLPRCVHWELD